MRERVSLDPASAHEQEPLGRAHQLGHTHDWVVLFYERNGDEGQCTVVTETRGPLGGRRVVRGRESECAQLAGAGSGARALPAPPG